MLSWLCPRRCWAALEQRSLRVAQLVQRISPVTLAARDGLAVHLVGPDVFGELAEAVINREAMPPAVVVRWVDEAAQLAVEYRRFIRLLGAKHR